MLKIVAARRQESRRRKKQPPRKKRPPNAVTVAVRAFATENGLDFNALSDADRGAAFERFATFHILRRFHDPEIAPAEVDPLSERSAGAECEALHAVALVADGGLVRDAAAVDALLAAAGPTLSVSVALVCATRANRFEAQRMRAFAEAGRARVAAAMTAQGGPDADAPEAEASGRRLLERLCAKARGSVSLTLTVYAYYASLGVWDHLEGGHDDRSAALAEARRGLAALDGVADAEFEPVDKFRLLDFMSSGAPLRRIPDAAELTLELEDYEGALPAEGLVALPSIKGVEGGFVGHAPVSAFLSLLEREDGQGLREGVFVQNVRGYQGDGGVNARIRNTLAGKERAQFLLRNNGVTVVADQIERVGGEVYLRNFQIVNGLQTSTVVYRMREDLRGAHDVHVPLKLVAATDEPVRRAIIDATNRQTPITGAALFAATEKARAIEEYFLTRARAGGPPLVLERRPGQYARDLPAERISLEEMLRAFYAVFLEQPHLAERGFSAIAGQVDDGLLAPSLTAEPYYAAARLLHFVRQLAKERDEPRLVQLEHHAALGLRLVCAPGAPPLGDAAAMRAMCRQIETRINAVSNRGDLGDQVMAMTQSPRDRMRSRVQGVPQLKRTRDDVVRRAMEAAKAASV